MNYTITFVPGSLSVTPAPLTIAADNKTKTVGAANPPLTFTANTFVNGDTAASLTTQPVLSTTATTNSSVGSYQITVSGAADLDYTISYVSGTLSVTAAGTATTTTLTSGVNPLTVGSQVTFTAVVGTATVSAASGTPAGTVTFMDGNAILGTGTLANNRGKETATFKTSSLTVGAHSITAMYSGGGKYAGSTSSALTEQVNKGTTTVSLASSNRAPIVGMSVTFTATVKTSGSISPTGSVTFKDGNMVLDTGALAVVHGQLQATFTTSSLAVGSHSITATYAGDTDNGQSTSAGVSEAVAKSTSSTTLSSTVNPASFGQPLTLTAVVKTAAGLAPTGSVTFREGKSVLGVVSLAAVHGQMQAALTLSSLSVATHSITAVYSGDANASPSTSSSLAERCARVPRPPA